MMSLRQVRTHKRETECVMIPEVTQRWHPFLRSLPQTTVGYILNALPTETPWHREHRPGKNLLTLASSQVCGAGADWGRPGVIHGLWVLTLCVHWKQWVWQDPKNPSPDSSIQASTSCMGMLQNRYQDWIAFLPRPPGERDELPFSWMSKLDHNLGLELCGQGGWDRLRLCPVSLECHSVCMSELIHRSVCTLEHPDRPFFRKI